MARLPIVLGSFVIVGNILQDVRNAWSNACPHPLNRFVVDCHYANVFLADSPVFATLVTIFEIPMRARPTSFNRAIDSLNLIPHGLLLIAVAPQDASHKCWVAFVVTRNINFPWRTLL